jgi:oxygen-independent coproporphyrinogen-3 oxidase
LTFANKTNQVPAYIDALKKEIKHKARLHKGYLIESIYFGGGTPSQIDSFHIGNILELIKKSFRIKKDAEISIECNPESITAKKLKDYQKFGINRLTVGIQSLKKETLFRIARPHNEQIIYSALELIRKAKIKNFGADLIMGLPFQTLNSFKTELNKLLEFNLPHLSLYFLSYDTRKIDIFIKDCPSEDEQIKMYNHACKTLNKNGYIHYEVSNYAKPGFECKHNLRYWNQLEYLGLGLGAHSYLNYAVSENTRDFNMYLKNPLAKEQEFKLDKQVARMDQILLNLRKKEGINLDYYKKKYGEKETIKLIKYAEEFIKSGHLNHKKNYLFATEKGFLLLDLITSALI